MLHFMPPFHDAFDAFDFIFISSSDFIAAFAASREASFFADSHFRHAAASASAAMPMPPSLSRLFSERYAFLLKLSDAGADACHASFLYAVFDYAAYFAASYACR